jgi:hypothetical protein
MEVAEAAQPRRYYWGCATALTLVGTLCLCTGLVFVQCSPPQESVTGDRVPVAIQGSVVVSPDGRTILYSNRDESCVSRWMLADETPTQIRLTVSDAPIRLGTCGRFAPGLPRSVPAPVTAGPLRQPVGSRQLVDGLTGRPVPWFDERKALRPTLQPTEWHFSPWDRGPLVTVVTQVPDFGGPGSATLAEVFTGSVPASGAPPGATLVEDRLWVIQTTGGWTPRRATVTTAVTVRGHPGRAAPGIIVWSEGGTTVAIRWDTVRVVPPGTDQLLAIAATLTPGEGR